jgi:hypothetical protein
MQTNARIQERLTNLSLKLPQHTVILEHIEPVRSAKQLEVRAEVIADGVLSQKEQQILKEKITEAVGEAVDVVVTFRYKL